MKIYIRSPWKEFARACVVQALSEYVRPSHRISLVNANGYIPGFQKFSLPDYYGGICPLFARRIDPLCIQLIKVCLPRDVQQIACLACQLGFLTRTLAASPPLLPNSPGRLAFTAGWH